MQTNTCAIFMDIYDFAASYILLCKSHIPWSANYFLSSEHFLQRKCSGFHVRHFTVCPSAPNDGIGGVRQYSWSPDLYVHFHVSRQQRYRTAWFRIFMNVVIYAALKKWWNNANHAEVRMVSNVHSLHYTVNKYPSVSEYTFLKFTLRSCIFFYFSRHNKN